MRTLYDMDTIQIEITNACPKMCGNCTRFCGHIKPFFMTFEEFKEAVDSMVDYPHMTGMMGGEPLIHPEFEKFCEYMRSKIKPWHLGLWTSLPVGFEHYREAICKTFAHIFINDHSRPDIFHHPPLVAIKEVIPDEKQMWIAIWNCWAQQAWSASINTKGAWFCEIAASLSYLFDEGYELAWKVEPGWWWRLPIEFEDQMEKFCPSCGFAAPIKRKSSQDLTDDISPGNLERLKDRSMKIKRGLYKIHDLSVCDMNQEDKENPMAKYKEFEYRNYIARRYGMYLTINKMGFWTPFLYRDWEKVKFDLTTTIHQKLYDRWMK